MSPAAGRPLEAVDPFDLPDWVALDEVTWSAEEGLARGHRLRGRLESREQSTSCDLLAVDDAYPAPVTDEATRTVVHQAWHHGQVHLARSEDRLALAVPGRTVHLDLLLEALRRLTLAVGGSTERLTVRLHL